MGQSKIKAIAVLIGLLGVSAFGSLSRTYNFSSSDLHFSTIEKGGETYTVVTLEGCYAKTEEIGAP